MKAQLLSAVCALLILWPAALLAQASDDREYDASYQAALAVAVHGPTNIPLFDQATVAVAPELSFVPGAEARRLMSAIGNSTSDKFIGILMARGGEDLEWFITLEYFPAGHVSREVAKAWTSDGLLKHMRIGTERGNVNRQALGAAGVAVTGWIIPPAYDEAAHRLSLASRIASLDPSAAESDAANLDAYVFGRSGYIQMSLVTSSADYAKYSPYLQAALASVRFYPGMGPDEFKPGVDPVTEDALLMVFAGLSAEEAKLVRLGQTSVAPAAPDPQPATPELTRPETGGEDTYDTFWMAGLLALLGVIATAFMLFGRREEKSPAPVSIDRALRSTRAVR